MFLRELREVLCIGNAMTRHLSAIEIISSIRQDGLSVVRNYGTMETIKQSIAKGTKENGKCRKQNLQSRKRWLFRRTVPAGNGQIPGKSIDLF